MTTLKEKGQKQDSKGRFLPKLNQKILDIIEERLKTEKIGRITDSIMDEFGVTKATAQGWIVKVLDKDR